MLYVFQRLTPIYPYYMMMNNDNLQIPGYNVYR